MNNDDRWLWLWSWYWPHPLALVVASCHMSPRAQYPRTSEGVPPPNDSIFWISNFSWVIIIDTSKGVLSRANIQHPKHHVILFWPPQHDKYWIFIIKYLSIMNIYLTSKASSHLFLTSPAWWTSTSWWSPAPDLKKEWMKNRKKDNKYFGIFLFQCGKKLILSESGKFVYFARKFWLISQFVRPWLLTG